MSCMKYQYPVDGSSNNSKFDGPRASVFLNHLPEVVLDMRGVRKVGSESPLVDSALGCGSTCSLTLPIFDDHSGSDRFVGVVECCMKGSKGMLVIFTELRLAVETISDLNPPMNEIEKALHRVCESHDLTIGQVWVPYDFTSKNHHGSSVKQWFLIKLNSYGPKVETVILLELLLLTLTACLPSFELVSGEKLGDQICVFDVQNYLGSGTGSFKILEGIRISQPSKPYKESTKRKCIDLDQQEE
nr:hypothetical protein [Tanacetum cinerariifolium]